MRGGNLIVTEQGIRDAVRIVMIPLWNSWYFFQLYANAFGDGQGYDARRSTDSTDPLDRYLLAKCRQYVEQVTAEMDAYAVADACETTRNFLDVLTNWYIRRSRDRFWGDSTEAFDTLYTVLEAVCRVTAPLLPMTTEEVWRGLTGERSVHLADWPDAAELPADADLVAAMDTVREVCSSTSALRKARSLRNRLPLASLTVVVDDPAALKGFEAIVADEVNVKSVRLLAADAPEAASYGVSQKLTVNARAAGPRLGKDVQQAIKGSKSGDWSVAADGSVTAGGLALVEGEYTLETVAGSADVAAAVGVLPGRRLRGAGHRGHARARRRGAGPRPGPRGAAGPPRRGPRRLRPDRADRGGLRRRAGSRPHARAADHRRDPRDVVRRAAGSRRRAPGDGHQGLKITTPSRRSC